MKKKESITAYLSHKQVKYLEKLVDRNSTTMSAEIRRIVNQDMQERLIG